EARAKHHEYVRRGSRERYQGLTFWSPNINLFRDPRWGRGQETYGEDPFLTGRLAVQFIRGMQGDDPKYLKTVATVKHFAVHSGPEPERHQFDAVVSERDLRESYLPHFETGIRDGGAYSLMCAYNRVDGKAACGSDMLLQAILRSEWGFRGYVVSDCGAIDDIYARHKVVQTAPEAAALAVKTGTDLECGRVYANLVDAAKQGLITEQQIDTAVTRLFLARFRLGMFDSPDSVRWARIPYAVVLFLGLTARMEGEEMPLQIEGFRGGDRTRIDLPASQQRLLERVCAVGKPTVLVLLNGSALAVNWAQEHVLAIVEAWYPGQAAGSAIADVLFGDYNPGGRLPVTFYRSVDDLPSFDDYHMAGRTYRFFGGSPLYPFGHG